MRSLNDWAALAKAERAGHESAGTVAKLFCKEMGVSLPAAQPAVKDETLDYAKLGQIAKLVGADKTTRSYIEELQSKLEEVQKLRAELDRREALFDAHMKSERDKLEAAKELHEKNLGDATDFAWAALKAEKQKFVDAVRGALAE
jgi:hypothetical protein